MSNKRNDTKLIFTSDKPVVNDELGTHKHLAELLVQVVKSDSDNPLVVGLFGGWGTGKSSIVKMYDRLTMVSDIKNAYIDAWVFANAKERFGAGLLEVLATKLIDRETLSRKIINDISQRYEEWSTKFDLGKMTWLLLFSVLFIFGGAVTLGLWVVGITDNTRVDLLVFLITTVVVNGLLNWVLPKIMVTYESRTIDESYNKVEHFQKIFSRIMKYSSAETISVVVDNLDRVEPADALEVIRMLKTFVDENLLNEKRLVLIVPCDENQLAEHIRKELYVGDAYEFLRKFFNISIPVPELVHENIIGYTRREFEKVRSGLYPAIDDENTELVSFIVSRAARRSPRQVKVLINSFVAFWQSAGLVGTAGAEQGITPLGAVIYVCLQYLLKNSRMPKNLYDLVEKDSVERNDKYLDNFVRSIKAFIYEVSSVEWLSLQRLQLSDDEKEIPNFTDIYNAIIDNNWDVLNGLFSSLEDLGDLVSRLDKKAREGGDISQTRFTSWALSLLAGHKLISNDLPSALRQYIKHRITISQHPLNGLVGEGLVEYIIQEETAPERVALRLDELKKSIEGGQLKDTQLQFIIRLIGITKTEYWLGKKHHDSLIGALDGVVFHSVPERDELIKVLLENIHVVIYDGTGAKLADILTPKYRELDLEEVVLKNMFDDIGKGNDGPYSFAAQWLRTGALDNQNISIEKNLLTLSSIEALLALGALSEDVKKRIPNEQQLSQLIGGIQGNCVNGVQKGLVREAFYGVITLSVLAVWAEESLEMRNVASSAKSSVSTHVWPQISGKFGELDQYDQKMIVDYFDKHPVMFNHIRPEELATLSQFEGMDILSRLAGEEEHYQLMKNVLGNLIGRPYFEQVITIWLKRVSRMPVSKASGKVEVDALCSVLVQRAPDPSKYESVVNALSRVKRRKVVKSSVRGHMTWLLENTRWADQASIDLSVKKMQYLEKIASLDHELVELLRGKINSIGDIQTIMGVLSVDTRDWLVTYLNS